MMTLKIGKFPGRLDDYAIQSGTTVREALKMAGISVGDEMEIKLDGEVVHPDDPIEGGNMLIVAQRIKGN